MMRVTRILNLSYLFILISNLVDPIYSFKTFENIIKYISYFLKNEGQNKKKVTRAKYVSFSKLHIPCTFLYNRFTKKFLKYGLDLLISVL